jgi:hypothetical protein
MSVQDTRVMRWCLSNRAERNATVLADRHHNHQKIGARQFVPPGRCMVLLTQEHIALWVCSSPYAEYIKHRWAGAWGCSCLRNESVSLSRDLIRQAGWRHVGYSKGGLAALQLLPCEMPAPAPAYRMQLSLFSLEVEGVAL